MTLFHEQLHQKAIQIADGYLRFEGELIGVLQELDLSKTYLHFKQPSLFSYATKCLRLSENIALTLIDIARKSVHVPELKAAIEERKISVSSARRIVPILTLENKTEWITKAQDLTLNQLNQELAKKFPEKAALTKIKYKSEFLARLEVDVSEKTLNLLKKAQDILSQSRKKHVDVAEALNAVLDEYVQRHDPVEKAVRVEKKNHRKSKPENAQSMKKIPVSKRIRFDATLKHSVVLRDDNQCTHIDLDGIRCHSRKWLDIHHHIPISHGGTNDLNNLKMMCSQHHRMIHLSQSGVREFNTSIELYEESHYVKSRVA